jgi:hypothetical protein
MPTRGGVQAMSAIDVGYTDGEDGEDDLFAFFTSCLNAVLTFIDRFWTDYEELAEGTLPCTAHGRSLLNLC